MIILVFNFESALLIILFSNCIAQTRKKRLSGIIPSKCCVLVFYVTSECYSEGSLLQN